MKFQNAHSKIILGGLLCLALSGCGKNTFSSFHKNSPFVASYFNSEFILKRAPDDVNLNFQSITTLFENGHVMISNPNLEEAFNKIATIQSATPEFHNELLMILKAEEKLTLPQALFLLDAYYFTTATTLEIKKAMTSDKICENLDEEKCALKKNKIIENLKLADSFGAQLNQQILLSASKILNLDGDAILNLIDRIYPLAEGSADLLQKLVDERDDLLTVEQKHKVLDAASRLQAMTFYHTYSDKWFHQYSVQEVEDILRAHPEEKNDYLKKLIPQMKNFGFSELSSIVLSCTVGDEREKIILDNLSLVSMTNMSDASLLIRNFPKIAFKVGLNIIELKNNLTGSDLLSIVESINKGSDRDNLLMKAIPKVTSIELKEMSGLVSLAYNLKIETGTLLVKKLNTISGKDLSAIAEGMQDQHARDVFLKNASEMLTDIDSFGVISMLALTANEKIQVALNSFAKFSTLSAKDLGNILRVMGDGNQRDLLIDKAIPLLKMIDGEGSAAIVEMSYNNKIANAGKLLKLIPNKSGTDLDKILSVCGSGNTRDQILMGNIGLLDKLTKVEASNLYTRAYDNKENVAILLMSKVDDIDGQTIGEIAHFSMKPATRDAIITEGLKRLVIVDGKGIIFLLKSTEKLQEKIILDLTPRLKDLDIKMATDVTNNISANDLKDKFLLLAIDIIKKLDEPSITKLAILAKSQTARAEIIKKGIAKIGGAR